MAIQTTFRRGNTLQHSTFTGALAELTVDTDKKVIVVHDGSTVGGFPLVKAQDLTTANVTEVSNQYFTNARARAAISVTGAGTYDNSTGVITVTGGVTSVGGATGAVSNVQLANAIITSGLLTTANVNELNNLYFTNARVYANLVAGNFATQSYVGTAISDLVASAPATLDTLNELATALGNDNNFATSILTIVGNKANTSVVTSAFNQANTAFAQANVSFNQANTAFAQANVSFDTANLNFTSANTYVNTRLLTKANVADLTTANVSELNNLYFTNTRVNAALTMQTLGNATFSGTVVANVLTASNIVITPEVRSVNGTTRVFTTDIGIVSIDVGGGQTKFYNNQIEVPGDILGGTFGGNRLSLTGNYASLQGLRNNRVQIQTGDVGNVNNTWTFNGVDGSLTVPGNIVPSSNLVHNLGSPTNRWKDLYLSGNTIDLGGTTISASEGGINFPEANITGNLYSGYITVVNSISANVWNKLYSANVIESSNLFYTNARVYANVSPMIDASFYQANTAFAQANVAFAQANIAFAQANTAINQANINFGESNTKTSVSFNQANVSFDQANTAFAQANISFATANINFTAANTYVNARLLTKANVADLTTANVSELTNLYFTNARVYANIIDGNFATQSYVGTAISNLVASAPATLDTLNELAVALGNDNNFATSIITIVGNKANTSVVTASFNQANTAFAQANVAFNQANLKFNSSGGNITGDTNITGNFIPSTDITYNLGSASKRWKDLFLSGNTINLGDATLSASGSSIQLPASSSIGGQTISSFSGAYNDLTNKPANVINFSNVSVSYFDTYNLLTINKNIYRSGEVRYNIMDDNSDSYSTVVHNFIHRDNVIVYSNTIVLLGTEVHTSHMKIDGDNVVLFLVSSNVYALNYFLTGDNYQSNVSANIRGYVTLIEV